MLTFLRKHSAIISIALLLIILFSSWQSSPARLPLAIVSTIFSLWVSISSIVEKHKPAEQAEKRRKIAREILLLALVTVTVMFLAGITGPLAGSYTGAYAQEHWPDWEVMVNLLTIVMVSFTVGFIVRSVILKLTHS